MLQLTANPGTSPHLITSAFVCMGATEVADCCWGSLQSCFLKQHGFASLVARVPSSAADVMQAAQSIDAANTDAPHAGLPSTKTGWLVFALL